MAAIELATSEFVPNDRLTAAMAADEPMKLASLAPSDWTPPLRIATGGTNRERAAGRAMGVFIDTTTNVSLAPPNSTKSDFERREQVSPFGRRRNR